MLLSFWTTSYGSLLRSVLTLMWKFQPRNSTAQYVFVPALRFRSDLLACLSLASCRFGAPELEWALAARRTFLRCKECSSFDMHVNDNVLHVENDDSPCTLGLQRRGSCLQSAWILEMRSIDKFSHDTRLTDHATLWRRSHQLKQRTLRRQLQHDSPW